MKSAPTTIGTFLIAFLSALLFFGGAGTLLLLFGPPLYIWATNGTAFQPVLPLAEAREEPFLEIDDIPPVTPYPPQRGVELLLDPPPLNSAGWIHVPAIGVKVPLAKSASMSDTDVLETLSFGAALYPNGIAPGNLGNTFISAHSTGDPWRGKYRFAFLRINELALGNEMHVDWQGTRYTYRVVGKDLIKPSPDFRVESGRSKPTLTLMACWPLWTTNQRLLVTGELTNITKLTLRPS